MESQSISQVGDDDLDQHMADAQENADPPENLDQMNLNPRALVEQE